MSPTIIRRQAVAAIRSITAIINIHRRIGKPLLNVNLPSAGSSRTAQHLVDQRQRHLAVPHVPALESIQMKVVLRIECLVRDADAADHLLGWLRRNERIAKAGFPDAWPWRDQRADLPCVAVAEQTGNNLPPQP